MVTRRVTRLSKPLKIPLELWSYVTQQKHLHVSVLGTTFNQWISHVFYKSMGTEKLLQKEKSATSKMNSQFELPFGTILWSPFFTGAEGAEEEQQGTCPGCHPLVALASHRSPELYLTSLADLDLLQFIIRSFRALLHAPSFLSLTGRIFYSPKRYKNVIKMNIALDTLLE